MLPSKPGPLVTAGGDKVSVGVFSKSPVHTREHLVRVRTGQGPWIFIHRKRRHQLAPPQDKVVKGGQRESRGEGPHDPTTPLGLHSPTPRAQSASGNSQHL